VAAPLLSPSFANIFVNGGHDLHLVQHARSVVHAEAVPATSHKETNIFFVMSVISGEAEAIPRQSNIARMSRHVLGRLTPHPDPDSNKKYTTAAHHVPSNPFSMGEQHLFIVHYESAQFVGAPYVSSS
jgi:hypothetical protein